jgi:hypothetical protein
MPWFCLPTQWCCVLALLAALASAGCEPKEPMGKVRGKVTLNGEPVRSGTVMMEGGPQAIALSAPIGKDGSYEMRTYEAIGLPPGTYKVAISAQRIAEGDAIVLATDRTKPPPDGPKIPEKYHTVDKSGLTAEVQAGDNPPFNFELK